MTKREKLLEQYEDALFSLLMDEFAESEGKAALEENERLKADPNFVVPKELQQRCKRTISHYFAKRSIERMGHIFAGVMRKTAMIALIAMLLFTTAFATSADFRIKTLNWIIEVFDDRTEFSFVEQESIDNIKNQGKEVVVEWIPEGFSQCNQSENKFAFRMDYAIKRNTPSTKQAETRKFRPWFRCGSKGCDCMISYCDIVESKIVEAMKLWWKEVTLDIAPKAKDSMTEEAQLDMMRKQLKNHFEQQNQICGLLERGIYTEEMFLKRNALLQGEIKELQSGIEELEEICHNKSEYRQAQEIFLPTTAHILDYYDRMTPEEKNRLWKLLMEKITYYRNPEKPDSIEIHLYPRLGRLISIS